MTDEETEMTTTASPAAGSWLRDPVLRLLVAGALLNSIAFFATLPFLTLYLSDISTLSPAAIGAVVGAVALIAAVGGLLGGVLTDRFGAVHLIRAGLALYIVLYVLLTVTDRVTLVIPLILLLGVGRLLVEPSMKKLLSLAAAGTGSAVFRIRYVTLCLGAIIGPLIGAGLYTVAREALFVLPAVVFTAYLVFFSVHAPRLRRLDAPTDAAEGPGGWSAALRDRTLLLVVAGGFVVFFVFSQFESILPLFVKEQRGAAAVGWFSVLLAANAALGILFQFPVERLSRRWSPRTMAAIGVCGFAVSLPLFGLLTVSPLFLFAGVVAWTVGEAVLLPLPDVLIHEHVPPARAGASFGLAELRYVGFFLGPVVGGALLSHSSVAWFGVLAVVVLAAWPPLAAASRHIRPGKAS